MRSAKVGQYEILYDVTPPDPAVGIMYSKAELVDIYQDGDKVKWDNVPVTVQAQINRLLADIK